MAVINQNASNTKTDNIGSLFEDDIAKHWIDVLRLYLMLTTNSLSMKQTIIYSWPLFRFENVRLGAIAVAESHLNTTHIETLGFGSIYSMSFYYSAILLASDKCNAKDGNSKLTILGSNAEIIWLVSF